MSENIQRPYKGLHTDSALYDQPKETYRFALNAINETETGKANLLSNEESNEIAAFLKVGYTPIGKIYMTGNSTVIFSVSSDETTSEIGILDTTNKYTTYINDA